MERWGLCILFAITATACGDKECTKIGTDRDGKPIMRCTGGAKGATATAAMKRYADAYAQWSTRSMAGCPSSLAELDALAGRSDSKDPWGNDYRYVCGDQAPPGVRGIGLISAGPDGRFDSPDDIRSW